MKMKVVSREMGQSAKKNEVQEHTGAGSLSARGKKRATVAIPQITESNSTKRLREKNRKIVESLKVHRFFGTN